MGRQTPNPEFKTKILAGTPRTRSRVADAKPYIQHKIVGGRLQNKMVGGRPQTLHVKQDRGQTAEEGIGWCTLTPKPERCWAANPKCHCGSADHCEAVRSSRSSERSRSRFLSRFLAFAEFAIRIAVQRYSASESALPLFRIYFPVAHHALL